MTINLVTTKLNLGDRILHGAVSCHLMVTDAARVADHLLSCRDRWFMAIKR